MHDDARAYGKCADPLKCRRDLAFRSDRLLRDVSNMHSLCHPERLIGASQYESHCGLPQYRRDYVEYKIWRDQAIRRIQALRPALVVLANSRRKDVTTEHWEDGARGSAKALAESGARLVLMRDTPRPGFDVPTCLARADYVGTDLSDACRFSLSEQLKGNLPVFEAERRGVSGSVSALLVDMTGYVCPDERCAVISGNVVHFSDNSHLTRTIATLLAPSLASKLAGSTAPRSTSRPRRGTAWRAGLLAGRSRPSASA